MTSTKASGKTAKLMVTESFVTLRAAITKVLGKMTSNTDLALRPGTTIKTHTTVNLRMVRKTVKESPSLRTILMMVIFKTGCFTAKEPTPLKMANITKVISRKISFRVTVL